MSALNLQAWGIMLVATLMACQSGPPREKNPTPAPEPNLQKPAPASTPVETNSAPPKPLAKERARELFEQATRSADAGDHQDAVDHLNELVALKPGFRRAYTRMGLLLLQLERRDEAQHAFEKAIQQDNEDAVAYNHLAVIQRARGRFSEALDNYRQALRADPDYANAHLNLAILLDVYLRDLPTALEHYEAYLRLSPEPHERVEKWVTDIRQRIEKLKNSKPSGS